MIVVNPADTAIELAWETPGSYAFRWVSGDGRALDVTRPISVPPRGWVLGGDGVGDVRREA